MKHILSTLCITLLVLGCRAHYEGQHRQSQDSLSLWQWEELQVLHERFDSTGQRLSERISLRATRLESLRHIIHTDSLGIERECRPHEPQSAQPQSKSWRLLGLGFVLGILVLAGAYRYWHRLRPQS